MTIDRILIVGLGSIGKRHLRLARELLPNADIRVLRHRPAGGVPEFANGCFFCIEDAVEFAPHIAVIANPAPFHLEVSRALAEAGANLLVEKPLSTSTDGVVRLLETCAQQGVVLSTGYNLRFLPSLQRFRELLDAGIIGQVLSVRCEIGQYLPTWRPDSDYRQGVSARRDMGGGVLLELSHEFDYLRWIFGDVAWVQASLSRQSKLEIDVEDTAHLMVGFVPSHENHQVIASINLDFIRHDTTRLCVAIGQSGSLRWNGLTGVVDVFEAGGRSWSELLNHPHLRDDSYVAEWRDFVECINKNKAPMISGYDGFRVLQIIEAARDAAALGRRVSVARMAQAVKERH